MIEANASVMRVEVECIIDQHFFYQLVLCVVCVLIVILQFI